MSAYYNENDPFAAAWLRNLVAAGHISPGDVDERSIVDVRADDLRGYSQCHFFAGIGGWSLALRLAGWDDARPVWTGSCPCQPFSAAGRGKAADDERHLWPAWASLIAECRPPVVFGEQVEAAIGWGWLDLVFAGLEAESYAVGAAVLPACGVGAPHIRQRLWWVADADSRGREGARLHIPGRRSQQAIPDIAGASADSGLADAGHRSWGAGIAGTDRTAQNGRQEDHSASERCGEHGGLANSECAAVKWQSGELSAAQGPKAGWRDNGPWGGSADGELGHADDTRPQGRLERGDGAGQRPAGAAGVGHGVADAERIGREVEVLAGRGSRAAGGERQAGIVGMRSASFWDDLVWLPCRDGKARPTKPSLQPLAHGVPGRVGKLRAAGNAIVAPLAAEFVSAFMECEP